MTAQLATLLQDALGPDYHLEQELERGGMSRLFLATDRRLNRRVVVKVLSPELASDTSAARFKREIELMVKLQHPHILPVLTTGSLDDVLYYITPFIPGESLKTRIEREGKLPLDDVVKILRDAAGALAFAHARGVVHRDIKPGNILLAEGHAILADFGIARRSSGTATQLTASGVVVGTPAYMAPGVPSDERADVYALGVVAFEMLTGMLPKRATTIREIRTARGTVLGDSRKRVRSLAELVVATLSLPPSTGKPVESANAFADRLRAVVDRPAQRIGIAMTSSMIVVLAGTISLIRYARTPAPADNRYLVAAAHTTDSLTSTVVRQLSDALRDWRGLSVSEVDGKIAGRASPRPRDVAASDGAARVVFVDAHRDGGDMIIDATLYAGSADTAIRHARDSYPLAGPPSARTMAMRRLANAMVREGRELPWKDAADTASPSLTGWRAYDAGQSALAQWDLSRAAAEFRVAVGAEPNLSLAHLWLAEALSWSSKLDAAAEIRASVRRAQISTPRLGERDSLVAAALLHYSEHDFAQACPEFRRLTVTDSTALAGWLGLGDCEALDRGVIPDRASPTGFVFRTSYQDAIRAYGRAADLGQGAPDSPFRGWLLGRLSSVAYTITNYARTGFRIDGDTTWLRAFPYLDRDTIAFAPYPASEFAVSLHDPAPELIRKAVARNCALLRQSAEEWARLAPKSAAAYDSLAAWTEVSGGSAMVAGRPLRTIEIVRLALRNSTDSAERVQLGVAETRLLLKDGQFASARNEAASLLRNGGERWAPRVPGIAGLAALIGRVDETSTLLARYPEQASRQASGGAVIPLPSQLVDSAARLVTVTALGIATDTVRALARHVRDIVGSYVPDTGRATELRSALVAPPLTYVFPLGADLLSTLGGLPDETIRLYALLARGDTPAARSKLADMRRRRVGRVSGTSVDGNFRRARLALLLGDTAVAIAELDPVLTALPTLSRLLMSQVTQVGSLVRAFAMRAEIASRARDRATARRYASAVVALWSDADPPLQPVVARMKLLAR